MDFVASPSMLANDIFPDRVTSDLSAPVPVYIFDRMSPLSAQSSECINIKLPKRLSCGKRLSSRDSKASFDKLL